MLFFAWAQMDLVALDARAGQAIVLAEGGEPVLQMPAAGLSALSGAPILFGGLVMGWGLWHWLPLLKEESGVRGEGPATELSERGDLVRSVFFGSEAV